MTKPKFTPGPWKTDFYNVEDYGVYMVKDSLNQAVCQCFTQYPFEGKPGITDDEAEANARLLAAAPEMYDFIEYLTTETGHILLSEAGYLGENLYNEAKELCRKARGESEVEE